MEMVRRQMDRQVWSLEKGLVWTYAFGNHDKEIVFEDCMRSPRDQVLIEKTEEPRTKPQGITLL